MSTAEMSSVKGQSPDELIHRIAGGEYVAHIARDFGVSKQALQQRIGKHPEYRSAKERGCESRIDATMAQFDALQVARPPLKPRETGDPAKDKLAVNAWKDEVIDWKNSLRIASVDLARVECLFRAVTWQAEREFPERWGTKPMTVNIGVQVSLTAVALGSIEDLLGAVVSTQQQADSATESAETLLNP